VGVSIILPDDKEAETAKSEPNTEREWGGS
jgi:hypothetical protein